MELGYKSLNFLAIGSLGVRYRRFSRYAAKLPHPAVRRGEIAAGV